MSVAHSTCLPCTIRNCCNHVNVSYPFRVMRWLICICLWRNQDLTTIFAGAPTDGESVVVGSIIRICKRMTSLFEAWDVTISYRGEALDWPIDKLSAKQMFCSSMRSPFVRYFVLQMMTLPVSQIKLCRLTGSLPRYTYRHWFSTQETHTEIGFQRNVKKPPIRLVPA